MVGNPLHNPFFDLVQWTCNYFTNDYTHQGWTCLPTWFTQTTYTCSPMPWHMYCGQTCNDRCNKAELGNLIASHLIMIIPCCLCGWWSQGPGDLTIGKLQKLSEISWFAWVWFQTETNSAVYLWTWPKSTIRLNHHMSSTAIPYMYQYTVKLSPNDHFSAEDLSKEKNLDF